MNNAEKAGAQLKDAIEKLGYSFVPNTNLRCSRCILRKTPIFPCDKVRACGGTPIQVVGSKKLGSEPLVELINDAINIMKSHD